MAWSLAAAVAVVVVLSGCIADLPTSERSSFDVSTPSSPAGLARPAPSSPPGPDSAESSVEASSPVSHAPVASPSSPSPAPATQAPHRAVTPASAFDDYHLAMGLTTVRLPASWVVHATVRNEGNESYRMFGWCEPVGPFMLVATGPSGWTQTLSTPCFHADPGPDGLDDGFYSYLAPGESWNRTFELDGVDASARPGALVLPDGVYEVEVSLRGATPARATASFTKDWGSIVEEDAAGLSGLHTAVTVERNSGGLWEARANFTNRSDHAFSHPDCGGLEIGLVLWDGDRVVGYEPRSCVPANATLAPGAAVTWATAWDGQLRGTVHPDQPAPPGRYVLEVRFAAAPGPGATVAHASAWFAVDA